MRTLLLVLAVAAITIASTCDSGTSPQVTNVDAVAAPRARLRLSGQLEGYLEPCGCAANQLGGLARRAFKIRQDLSYDLLIEGGNTIATNTELDIDKLIQILQVLDDSERRYHALGVGKRDLELMDNAFIELIQGFQGLATISSDLKEKEVDGGWPFKKFAELDAGEAKVRIASLTIDAPKGFELVEPQAAWTGAMDGVADDTFRIVMVHAPSTKVVEMTKLQPTPDLVIGINGAHPHPPNDPHVHNDVPVVYPGTRGRHLVDVWLTRKDGRPVVTKYDAIQLSGSKTAKGAMQDPNVVSALKQHRLDVKEAGLRESMAEQFDPPTKAEYVGSEECADCHETAYKVWKESKHGHAWTTLVDAEGSEKYPWPVTHYPDCVQCHVVGYQQKTGFINPEKTPQLMHVGCEECHGPGSEHIESAEAGQFLEASLKIETSVDICMRCHTYEQTPTFSAEYLEFWEKIKHGHDDYEDDKGK